MEFIDPKTDYAFKRIFGSEDSQETLISFINASLKLTGDRQVESVVIKNPYQVQDLPVLKESIVDVSCTDGRGVHYLVEMQVGKVKGFANRLIHNLAKCYASLPKGTEYPDMDDVVLIAVMDFILFEDFVPFHSIYQLKDMETNYAPFNQLKVCCIELKKFSKGEEDLKSMLDKWCWFLREAPNLDVRPRVLGEKVFDQVFEKSKSANLTLEERELYDVAWQKILDETGKIEQGREEGRKEGRREGRKEGRKEGKKEGREDKAREMALSMLEDDLEMKVIERHTGLSKQEIRQLAAHQSRKK